MDRRTTWREIAGTLGPLQAGRQAGNGMACSRAKARLNWVSQGQRRGRCKVRRRAERVIRPTRAKTRRLRVLVITVRSPRPIRAVQRARLCAITWTASQAPLAANLARWTARIGLGERTVITKTLRPLWWDGSPARRAASLCISPGAGLGKPSSVAPWPGCKPFHSRPDGQPATGPRNLAPPRSRESPAAYPLAIPRIATPA